VSINHVRHMGIFSVADYPVTLIGAGGIGAITALTLGKMGVPAMNVWDGDTVSSEKTGTQFYSPFDIESPKVAALGNYMRRFADDTMYFPVMDRIEVSTPYQEFAAPIIISAVDNITVRKDIWVAIARQPWDWYLDARMSAEVFQLFTVLGTDRQWYQDNLAAQDESMIADVACTEKATIFCAMAAAAHGARPCA